MQEGKRARECESGESDALEDVELALEGLRR